MSYTIERAVATPPGPRGPGYLLGLSWLLGEPRYFPRWHERYGDIFTLHSTGFAPPLTVVSDPAEAKRIFAGDRATVRPGEANMGPLRQLVGMQSLLLLDEDRHLNRRRMMLPPFHGERMRLYGDLMAEIANAEIDRWPIDRAFALHPSMQAITLRVILRAVLGIEGERQLAELEKLYVRYTNQGMRPWMLLMAQRELPRFGPWRRFLRTRMELDELLYAEIERRKKDRRLDSREDVLSLLIQARDEDGKGLSAAELRDQLMTLLLAGHETTATGLAWAFERLLRTPEAMERLMLELSLGGEEYLGWVAQESLRCRPVIPFVLRYLTAPLPVGEYVVPAESLLAVSISLIHMRPDLYPDPTAFRPERFEDGQTESFAWLPFGGGVRRCLGAAFATYEMRVVLRCILERCELLAPDPEPERPRRRAVTFVPAHGTRVLLKARSPARATERDNALGFAD